MPLNTLLAIGSGLLGGYAKGQQLKESFEKEREELAFKKKHLDVQEGLLQRQVAKDAADAQRQASEIVTDPEFGVLKKYGGGVVQSRQPFNLRDALVESGAMPSPPVTAPSQGQPQEIQPGGIQIPPGAKVTTPSQPGRRPTVTYDPIAATQENRRVVAEGKLTELAKTIGPDVDWATIQSQAQQYLDIPLGKALFDRATTELDKMLPAKPSEDRESTADRLFSLPWRKLTPDQKTKVDSTIEAGKIRVSAAGGQARALSFIGGGLELSGLTPEEIAAQVDMAAKSIVSGDRSIQDMEALLGPRNWSVLGPRVSAKVNELTGGKGPPAAVDANAARILTALGPAKGETGALRDLLEPFRTINSPGYFAPWRLLYAAGASPGTPAGTAAEAQARQEAAMKFFRGRYETLNGDQQTKVDKYLELGRRVADFELNRINAMLPYFRAAGGRPNEMFQEMVKKHITQLWKDSPQLLYEKLTTIGRQFDRMDEAARTYGRKTGVPGVSPPALTGPGTGGQSSSRPRILGITPRQSP